MTSSFSNLVGTERDRIPELPVSNYASTEANMEEAVNKQIDTNIADQERFFKELGDIEALKAQNFFDNLSSLNQLVGSVAQFQEAREKNREARETLKFAKNLYETKQNEFLEFQEKRRDMTDSEQEAVLREMAGGDPQIYEFLKARYAPDLEQLESNDFRRGYNDFAVSGFKNRVQGRNLLNKATRQEAVDGTDDIIENIVTKYFIDADAKGLNIQSRDLRRHFLKELYPSLIKAKEETLNTYDRVSTNNYLKNVDRDVDNLIVSTINSKNASTGEYDGIIDDEEVGLIQIVMNKKGLSKKLALNHIIERTEDLKGRLESGGIAYLINKAKFKHSGKKDSEGKPLVTEGYANAGIGTQGEVDGNIKFLNNILSEAVKGNDKLYNTEVKASQERVRQLELQDLSETEYNMAIAEEQALFFRKLKSLGLESYAITPPHLLKDETSGVGNEPYSNQVGRANKIFDIVNVEEDFLVKLRAAKRDPNLELTSLQKNVQVKAAEYDLTQKVNKRMAGDRNLTLEAALKLEYEGEGGVLEKLLKGDYSAKVDITRPTLAIDIENDRNYIKTKGIDAVMNQKGFISLDHKRALDQLYDYYESGFKTPFPQYFREVTHGTNVMPHEFALATYKANFPGDTSNMKNPETFFDLTEQEQRFLYLRKNQTKNLNLLNNDDNTEIEAKMLNSLKVTDNADYYRDPNSNPFTKPKVKLEEMAVADAYRKAKAGATDFGMFKISAQELIEVVEAGGIRVDGVMDEKTQNAMVFGLMRIQANKSNGIMGALVDADRDWRFLTNLSDDDRTQVLQFFPNLRGMTNNQFQNLQADINEIILDKVRKPTTNTEKFFDGLIKDYVENDFGGITN